MQRFSLFKLLLVLGFVFGLAACESSAEKAEAHYQSGIELLESGDSERAAVEFRNVLQLNGEHREARIALAEIQRTTGNVRGAYSQYLRVAEQYADDVDARIALTEMAIEVANWEEAHRHGTRALELAPEDPAVEVIALNLAYADAIEAEDAAARRVAARSAQARLDADPENILLLRILIDNSIREAEYESALGEIEKAKAIDPDMRSLYDVHLGLLAQLERPDEIEPLLREMLERFPDDENLPGVMLRFYIATDDTDTAQSFLREIADTAEDEATRSTALVTLVRLRLEAEGRDAALGELATLIETEEDTTVYRSLQAGLLFENGQRSEGISEMEALLETDITPDETSRIKVGLAQMLIVTGDSVGARAYVEEVLASDPTQPEALKIKAAWLIESDETEEALALLRLALDQDSEDPAALSLTAQAYARSGERNLAREFLALAVEAADAAVPETLSYADFLIDEERYLPAEEALLTTLRQSQDNLQILQRLGTIYLRTEDWGRARQVEDALSNLDDPTSAQLAASLRAARLAAQGQMEDAVASIESYAAGVGQAELAAQVAVIQARLVSGDAEGALSFAEDLVAADPDDLERRFVLASVQTATGAYEAAEQNYRSILDEAPQSEQAWIDLIRNLHIQGDTEGAETALEDGLSALPEGLRLLWAQASFSEQRGDIDGAIALYEIIYERVPNDFVAANNLASLIATYREGEESLDRAYAIARRLRGTDVAPFQDTYGWIAYRRGDLEDALEHLEPAAQGLPTDPLVQFHLGMTYIGLERDTEALEVLQRALEIAGPDDERPQFDTARSEVVRIQAAQQEADEPQQ